MDTVFKKFRSRRGIGIVRWIRLSRFNRLIPPPPTYIRRRVYNNILNSVSKPTQKEIIEAENS